MYDRKSVTWRFDTINEIVNEELSFVEWNFRHKATFADMFLL